MKFYKFRDGRIRPAKISMEVRESIPFMCVKPKDASVAIEFCDQVIIPDEMVYATSSDGNPVVLFEDGDVQVIPKIGKFSIRGNFVQLALVGK